MEAMTDIDVACVNVRDTRLAYADIVVGGRSMDARWRVDSD